MQFYPLAFLFFFGDILCAPNDSDVASVATRKTVNGIRIAWDYATLKQLSPDSASYSGYARMIKLLDGSLFCVYESDKSIHGVRSLDGGVHWSEPAIVARPENNVACAVPEVLQLQDKSIVVSYNLRPPRSNTDPRKGFSIQFVRSVNAGQQWSAPVEVYRAGHEFNNGCWEPAQMQLPSGEILLFIANEGPYTHSNEQEITVFQSADQGQTWSKGQMASFRSGHRDGMPVPLFLKNKNEIIVAIEDNGISGEEFKPVIIRSRLGNSANKRTLPDFNTREYAMAATDSIPEKKYAGAPYLRQLPSGDVILSYQSNELRSNSQWDQSDMIVSIGNSEGRHFNRKSVPFYFADSSKTALWNSICVENDSTIIALSSTNAYGRTAVWMIKGYVLPEIKCIRATDIQDDNSTAMVKSRPHIFIGGYGSTQAKINTTWDSNTLYLIADVNDEKVFDGNDVATHDAISFYLDPQNLSPTLPDHSIFSITVTASGRSIYKQGKNKSWADWSPSGIEAKSRRSSEGYRIDLAIPWSALKYVPKLNERIGLHAVVLETSTGIKHDYTESISGNITNAPYSWSPLYLID